MKPLNYAMLAPAMLLLASCASEQPWGPAGEGNGKIDLTLTTSGQLGSVSTTRATSEHIDVPPADDFHVTITKVNGGFSKEYETLAAFQDEAKNVGFAMGTYDIVVYHGDPNDQGEGTDHAYFEGHEEVTIKEGMTEQVEIKAELGNAVIRVNYSDAFKKYFKDWSTTVQTEGASPVNLEKSEGDNWFITPGKVNVTINCTNQNDQTVPLNAGTYTVQAGYLHTLNYEVFNGEVGDVQLALNFDDSVVEEPFEIDLTDELFAAAKPEITAVGFTDGENILTLTGNKIEGEMKFNVMAPAGIASATLNIATDQAVPAFGSSIDLIKATPEQQQQIAAAGFRAMGFFRNPDKMALLDMTEFCQNLKEGTYTISLSVTDKLGRASNIAELGISAAPVEINATAQSISFGDREALITLSYNGTDPTKPGMNPFRFEAQNDFGGWVEAPIMTINDQPYTRSFEAKDYVYKIQLPESTRKEIPVRVYFNDEVMKDDNNMEIILTIPVVVPEYSVEFDAYAKKALVKVTAANTADQNLVESKIKFYLGNKQVTATRNSDGYLELSDLTPATNYAFSSTLTSEGDHNDHGTLTTEAAADVPNGDFSQTEQTINMTGIQVGGQYKVWPVDYTIKSSIVINEPTGWASINQKTAYKDASNKNTWFIVPSTIAENGAVRVRSVAYDHNGTTPATSGGAGNTKYYCENAPTSIASRAAGELFLGTYSYLGSVETRTDGISFASRPSSVSFEYKYTPYGSETGEAYVSVIAADGSVIASGTKDLTSSSAMSSVSIPLSYSTNFYGKKAAKLQLGFRSTKGETIGVTIPSGSALKEGISLGNATIGANTYHALATGSELIVDNVTLNY